MKVASERMSGDFGLVVGDTGVQRLSSSSFRPLEPVLLDPAFALCPRLGLVCQLR
jgi:hypothetical protein